MTISIVGNPFFLSRVHLHGIPFAAHGQYDFSFVKWKIYKPILSRDKTGTSGEKQTISRSVLNQYMISSGVLVDTLWMKTIYNMGELVTAYYDKLKSGCDFKKFSTKVSHSLYELKFKSKVR